MSNDPKQVSGVNASKEEAMSGSGSAKKKRVDESVGSSDHSSVQVRLYILIIGPIFSWVVFFSQRIRTVILGP